MQIPLAIVTELFCSRHRCRTHTARNEDLIKLLTERPTGSMYYPFPYLDFMYGYAKLNRLDDADIYIKKFIATNKGRSCQKKRIENLRGTI